MSPSPFNFALILVHLSILFVWRVVDAIRYFHIAKRMAPKPMRFKDKLPYQLQIFKSIGYAILCTVVTIIAFGGGQIMLGAWSKDLYFEKAVFSFFDPCEANYNVTPQSQRSSVIFRIEGIQGLDWQSIGQKMFLDADARKIPFVIGTTSAELNEAKELTTFLKQHRCQNEIALKATIQQSDENSLVMEKTEVETVLKDDKYALEELVGRKIKTYIPLSFKITEQTRDSLTKQGFQIISGKNNGWYDADIAMVKKQDIITPVAEIVKTCLIALKSKNHCVITLDIQDFVTSDGKADQNAYYALNKLIDIFTEMSVSFTTLDRLYQTQDPNGSHSELTATATAIPPTAQNKKKETHEIYALTSELHPPSTDESTGGRVSELQKLLENAGDTNIKITGEYDIDTALAISRWEHKNNLKLQHSFTLGSKDSATESEVSKLQQFLKTNGADLLQVTGYFDLETEKALKSWQQDNNLPQEEFGYIGPETRQLILEISGNSNSKNGNFGSFWKNTGGLSFVLSTVIKLIIVVGIAHTLFLIGLFLVSFILGLRAFQGIRQQIMNMLVIFQKTLVRE